MKLAGLDEFTRSYIETALWLCHGEDGEPIKGASFYQLTGSTLVEAIADCAAFQAAHADDIESDPGRAGHDFYLTRNRHGAGFWDGDWPPAVGRALTDAAHVYGTWELERDVNRAIHSHG